MKAIILVGLFFFLVQCSVNKEDNDDFHPESFIGTWTDGKDIAVNYNSEFERLDYSIVDGDQILFEYNHTGAQRDDVLDDEWGEMIRFILNKDATSFEFTDEEIEDAKCFYQIFGAWFAHNQYSIKDGIIKGRKINSHIWEIYVSIETTPLIENQQPVAFEFSLLFTQVR